MQIELPWGDKRLKPHMTKKAVHESRAFREGYFAGMMSDRANPRVIPGYIRYNEKTKKAVQYLFSYEDLVAISWLIYVGAERQYAAAAVREEWVVAKPAFRNTFARPDRDFTPTDIVTLDDGCSWVIGLDKSMPSQFIYQGDYGVLGVDEDGDAYEFSKQAIYELDCNRPRDWFKLDPKATVQACIMKVEKRLAGPKADRVQREVNFLNENLWTHRASNEEAQGETAPEPGSTILEFEETTMDNYEISGLQWANPEGKPFSFRMELPANMVADPATLDIYMESFFDVEFGERPLFSMALLEKGRTVVMPPANSAVFLRQNRDGSVSIPFDAITLDGN